MNTVSDVERVMTAASDSILRNQMADGRFSYCCEVNPLADAFMVIFLHLMDEGHDALVGLLTQEIIKSQSEDGSWRGYDDGDGDITLTTLCYFALLLSDVSGDSPKMTKAEAFIRSHGGISEVANLAKILLAVAGELPWHELPSAPIELFMLGPNDWVSMYDLASFARLHVAPFMILSHRRFSFRPSSPKKLTHLYTPKSHWPQVQIDYNSERATKSAVEWMQSRLEPNGTIASYLTATAFATFAFIAVGYPREAGVIQDAIRGLKEMVYQTHTFTHAQFFTSTVWDTALCMRALRSTKNERVRPALNQARGYLISRQQTRVSDWVYRAKKGAGPGGWGFSDVNTFYPDVDDTIAVLNALGPYRVSYSSIYKRGVQWLFAMQNDDGGWAAFDRNNNKSWLEYLPINDMGQAMTDPSTVDITGRVLETLGSREDRKPWARRAVQFIRREQRDDGSWFGRWGISFIYGTWTSLVGLRQAGVAVDDGAVQKAVKWLLSIQNKDGGFGESCRGDVTKEYTVLNRSNPSQTAWALMGLMAGLKKPTPECTRAVEFLLEAYQAGHGWIESYPTGAGVSKVAYLRYHSYPHVWPLLALSKYLRLNHH